jgi:Zn-dependent M28 family amino/carboxypeptidase
MNRLAVATVAWAALAAGTAAAEGYKPDANAIRAHMSFLAADELRGREAGTREYDIAANYVAARFMEYGLTPAGGQGGYLQRIAMTTYVPGEGKITLAPRRGGAAVPLVFGEDYFPGATPLRSEVKLDAPLAFAGFGVVAPGYKHDDYKGLDVKGKIVVVLTGAPKRFHGEERAHYGNGAVKRAEAMKRGAVGMITVYTPTREKVLPFARLKLNWNERQMTWNDAAGTPWYPAGGVAPVATVSMKGAEKLFAGAPATAAAILAAAEEPAGAVPRFALPQRASVELKTEIGQAVSSNVAALIEGSDPKLRDQVIVLSGHLDHEGVGAAQDGDAIHNGAMDNASGIATMLEVAHAFKHDGARPRRSVMFLAVTAEEKGLIGAEYFAHNPTVPKSSLVANVNLDMPILSYDFRDVVAFGADRSTIGAAVKRAAESLGLGVSPDPNPDQGIFTRSDHYRFVQQGVPSVFLKTGPANGGAEADRLFRSTRYHRPNDDLSQPIDYDAAARFAAVNYAIARELADAPERPRWNKGDFFGTQFGGYGAE